jgi:hypothetical protein
MITTFRACATCVRELKKINAKKINTEFYLTYFIFAQANNPTGVIQSALGLLRIYELYKFGQEIFIIGIFWKFLCKYLKTIPVKAA